MPDNIAEYIDNSIHDIDYVQAPKEVLKWLEDNVDNLKDKCGALI